MLSDFPVALLTASVVTDFVAMITETALWWQMSFWLLVGGVASSLAAAVIGIIDASEIDSSHPASDAVTTHMSLMLVAVGFAAGSIFFRLGLIAPFGVRRYLALGFSIVGVALLFVGGWYGGELVFRHGVGRYGPRRLEHKDRE
jgi:uncharacterized membrane protein